MKITIVTVCYNSSNTIRDTLRSVASQSHRDIEHIVIDGGSKDTTLDVVREHGGHLARIVSEPDKGIYDAMNKGFTLATGQFVGFLNADDILASGDAVASVARVAASDDSIDAVYGDLQYVRGDGQVVRHWRSGEFDRARLSYGWMPPHPTLYVRTAKVTQLGGFSTKMRIAADYDFVLRYFAFPGFKAAYLPEVLVRMRTGGASNRSLGALLQKSREDLTALRANGVGGVLTLACKNLRKLPQFRFIFVT